MIEKKAWVLCEDTISVTVVVLYHWRELPQVFFLYIFLFAVVVIKCFMIGVNV